MRKYLIAFFTLSLSVAAVAQAGGSSATPQTLRAVINTTMGTINCELYPDKAPMTVDNFVGLATGTKEWTNPASRAKMKGKPLYNGTIFHRVIPGFMIQGGDPLGNGSGDPGYSFKDEFSSLRFDQPGRLAMANSGPGTNGSQFFITEVPTPHLNNRHTIFGQCGPMSVISGIARVPRDPMDKPFKPVKIISVKILKPGQAEGAATTAPAKAASAGAKSASKAGGSTTKKPATTPKQ
jgi:cyclophilin family peptidyl-prolyl cis-trans isomerase